MTERILMPVTFWAMEEVLWVVFTGIGFWDKMNIALISLYQLDCSPNWLPLFVDSSVT